MTDLLVIEHEIDSPPGSTLEWARLRGIKPLIWKVAHQPAPCKPEDVKAMVICGGSMDVFEEERCPWLKGEKKFISDVLRRETPVMGLCLGSQLIAEVLGGKVYSLNKWEIGFIPVEMRDLEKPYTLNVFHWHQCTFDLPKGAELIATNDFCKNQAFRWGSNVIATQFHPETTVQWVHECAAEVNESHQGLVQKKEEMLNSISLQSELQKWYFSTLDKLFIRN